MTVYEAKCLCNVCSFKSISRFEAQIQRISEEHMMTTGHIVDIIEY